MHSFLTFHKKMSYNYNTLKIKSNVKINYSTFQRQPPEVFYKNGVLRNLTKFTGKHLCHSLFSNKVSLLKKRLWHKCYPVNFAKFLRTRLLQNTSDDCFLGVFLERVPE